MKILILTEGSSKIGFGHITRCISLYQSFEEKNILPTIIINGDNTIKDLLAGKKYVTFNWLKEKDRLFHLIEKSDLVIIDSLISSPRFLKKISEIAKMPVFLDDYRRLEYSKGIVVDWTILAEKLKFRKQKNIKYFLGNKYVSLRKEFWNAPQKIIKKNIKTIMVTFGGEDIRNLTPKVLKLINSLHPGWKKIVIVGKAFKNIKQIEKQKDKNTELVYFPGAIEMKKVMARSDLAFSAGGQTLYELARMGTPTIAICVINNQIYDIKGWKKTDFIEYAGEWNSRKLLSSISSAVLRLSGFELRKNKSRIGQNLVDGQGAIRLVDSLIRNAKIY